MDYFPLVPQIETPSLTEGVMVIYEKHDVAGILDFLFFLNSYRTLHKKKLDELPAVFVNGKNADPKKLFTHLNGIFPGGAGSMNTDIVTQIMDNDREFFEEYMNHLEDLILVGKHKNQENTDHPLYDTYDMFLDIEFEFFPPRDEMH